MKRPISVTVVAYLIIANAIVVGIPMLLALLHDETWKLMLDAAQHSPLPTPIYLGFAYVGVVLALVCGIYIMRGKGWARFLYICWSSFGGIVGVLTIGFPSMVLGAAKIGVFAFFLFRSAANRYFGDSPKEVRDGPDSVAT